MPPNAYNVYPLTRSYHVLGYWLDETYPQAFAAVTGDKLSIVFEADDDAMPEGHWLAVIDAESAKDAMIKATDQMWTTRYSEKARAEENAGEDDEEWSAASENEMDDALALHMAEGREAARRARENGDDNPKIVVGEVSSTDQGYYPGGKYPASLFRERNTAWDEEDWMHGYGRGDWAPRPSKTDPVVLHVESFDALVPA